MILPRSELNHYSDFFSGITYMPFYNSQIIIKAENPANVSKSYTPDYLLEIMAIQ